MKIKFLSIIGVVAFAVALAFSINANLNNNAEINVVLANVEALVLGENYYDCMAGCPGDFCNAYINDIKVYACTYW